MNEPAPVEFVPYRIESWARTHEGRVRDHNEDSYCAREPQGLWAVADGMGGHEGGEWASAKLAEALSGAELTGDFDEDGERVAEAIRTANGAIVAEARRRGRQMGSTIVALLVRDRRHKVLWVGDSRAYLLRGAALIRLSRDHSQVQEMVDRGLLSAEEAVGHPMSHILSRAVGVGEAIGIDRAEGEVLAGDVFLLSSDGLHGYVDEKEIARLLGRGPPESVSHELVELTLANGAPDNVTVAVIQASEPTLLSLPEG